MVEAAFGDEPEKEAKGKGKKKGEEPEVSEDARNEACRLQKIRRAIEKISEAKCSSCPQGAASGPVLQYLEAAQNNLEAALAITRVS